MAVVGLGHRDSRGVAGMGESGWHGRCSMSWSEWSNDDEHGCSGAGNYGAQSDAQRFEKHVRVVGANAGGQVVILICVALLAIMGMIGVVTDLGFLHHQRNMMQTAADSAAMAGAEELHYGDQVAAGKADAASNGYTNGQASVSVAINNPPSTGPNTSNATDVEAIVVEVGADVFSARAGIQLDNGVGARGRIERHRSQLHLRDGPERGERDDGQRKRGGQQRMRSAGGFEFVDGSDGRR